MREKIYCKTDNNELLKMLSFLRDRKDIAELLVNSDVEIDYGSLSLSGVMIKSEEFFYPIAAGFDVGCGLGVFKTDLPKIDIEKLKLLFDTKKPFKIRRSDCEKSKKFESLLLGEKLGRIEEGNHFIEIREELSGEAYIVVHSGITGNIKLFFMKKFIESFKNHIGDLNTDNAYILRISKNSDEVKEYMHDFNMANDFARMNRYYIASQLAKKLNCSIVDYFDTSHEFVEEYENYIVHCNGVQKFTDFENNLSALILSGADEKNHIVFSTGKEKYINHGTHMHGVNSDGKRIYSSFDEIMKNDEFADNISLHKKLLPVCGCKNMEGRYEYKIYKT